MLLAFVYESLFFLNLFVKGGPLEYGWFVYKIKEDSNKAAKGKEQLAQPLSLAAQGIRERKSPYLSYLLFSLRKKVLWWYFKAIAFNKV